MGSVPRERLVIGTRYQITSSSPAVYRFGTWSSTPANPIFEIPEKNEFHEIKEYKITLNALPNTDFPDTSKPYTFLSGKKDLEDNLIGLLTPSTGGTRKRQKRRTTTRKRV